MICIIAMIIFGIMGVFSATHRKIAIEAFDCVFKKVTLRPCTTGLDKRLKSAIIGKLLKKNQRIAKFTHKHFELLSWIFTIITIVSLIYSVIGIYNFAAFGNCNGKDSNGVCIYKEIADIGGGFKADPGCQNPSCQNINCTCSNSTECLTKNLTHTSCNATCIYGSLS